MSGEALTRTQSMPSSLTAIDDWVRLTASMVPLRTPSQLKQLQFHCGNPPPAAEPRIRIFNSLSSLSGGSVPAACGLPARFERDESTVRDVHRDFKTKTDIDCLRGLPDHGDTPLVGVEKRMSMSAA